MKTRVFKKVLSIICVLAMLMSVCVVSLAGTSSAAESYSLNVNGKVTTESFNRGDTLPEASYPGTSFEGWYDSTFTTKYTTAGDERTLYAKFTSTVVDFEVDGDNNWRYHPGEIPNNHFNSEDDTVVTDPTNPNNKVLRYKQKNHGPNFGVPVYPGINSGFVLAPNTTYQITYRYYSEDYGSDLHAKLGVYAAEDAGVSNVGHKTELSTSSERPAIVDREWQTASYTFTTSETVGGDAAHKYLVLIISGGTDAEGYLYFDDIMITPVVTTNYTFNNNGTVTTETMSPGDALPAVRGPSFEGWYDKTLTYKYDKVPATTTELYAKYNKVADTFDNADYIYDSDNILGTGFSIVNDTDTAGNKVLKAEVGSGRIGYAIRGAVGADSGYTITKGQVYSVSFKYKASGITASDNNVMFNIVSDADITEATNPYETGWNVGLENTDTWKLVEKQFIVNVDAAVDFNIYKNILFSIGSATAGTVYIDDLTIAPYSPISTDEFEMDFEGTGNSGFKWSVADANNYTTGSGNGYVNRGQLVTEGSNTFFRIKHFAKKGAYIYFTLDDGSKQFNVVNYGLYTIEFDYKVEHSETPSAIGLAFVKPTTASTGFKIEPFAELVSFEYRDDSDWAHVTYSFGADLVNCPDYTSLALYVYNSTNVPEKDPDSGEEYATSVAFDNIKVSAHSPNQEDGMVIFDSLGGTTCTSVVTTAGMPVGTLPQPTKYGYVFQGWKYDVEEDGVTVTKDLTATTLMPEFVTFAYADWKLADGVIELDFRTNVDSYDAATPTIVAFPGKPISNFPTVNPTAAGQKFIGWYYDTAFTKPVDVNCAPNESATIYAKWESQGTLVDFEEYPSKFFTITGVGNGGGCTDRMSIEELDDGNHVLYYDFSRGGNQNNTNSYAGIMLYKNGDLDSALSAYVGFDYTVTFKYKVIENKGSGVFGMVLAGEGNLWDGRTEQVGTMKYGDASDQWLEGSITFTATLGEDIAANKNYLAIGISDNCKIYIDDVVVHSDVNDMNIYGSAVVLNTNGGKNILPISGDVGTKVDLPTPVKPGYKFLGWYLDEDFTTPATDLVYAEETITVYAKWQLGKFIESFEDFPSSVKALGVAGAYSFYTKDSAGFDASNIHSGDASLFRSGTSAGAKSFTTARSSELALNVGDTYTLSFYVKPTSVTDAAGTISMIGMAKFTEINNPTSTEVIAKVSDLKEDEWNLVTYTFTATSEFVGIQTTAGNDMYFDDISVTLKGYTGSSANTGDSSVNPIFVIALIIVCAGALIITGKKVFSK